MTQGVAVDPSHPVSTRLQKWLVFSAGLALFGVGSDVLASVLATSGPASATILGRGELYMVAIRMLFSAAGELLYERTRLERAGSWQVTLAIVTMMISLFPASLFGLAKAGMSDPDAVTLWSVTFTFVSTAWGVLLILLTGTGTNNEY